MMQLAICGKSNCGKTTFFSAATLVDAEISNRIFTTIKPNMGVSYVRVKCPCKELGVQCNPQNSTCISGQRFVPVKMIDIAGLVPGAHEGRGLGNAFLTDIMTANALIHVVDISGSTDKDGNPVALGTNNPEQDIEFLEKEIDYWMLGIIKKAWPQVQKKTGERIEDMLYRQLSGLMVSLNTVKYLIEKNGISPKSSEEELLSFITELRAENKPIIIAANKIDVAGADKLYEKIRGSGAIPCCAEAELALRRATEKGLVRYLPGDEDFEIIGRLDEKQLKGMEFVHSIMKKYNGTGVQKVINSAVFDLLGMIVVYPVENESRYSDKKGNALPDALLLPGSSNAKDLAYAIHEDIGNKFISATDCRTGQRIGAEHELKNGDIVSIKAGR
ncbi:MAG: redox-regulated ATPase YchF [Candidatus Aenigmarchaeota archaeon]|nr:redox-regulated ATPase YchF [Candidatus Aenigmarchaeota archaeon]